MAETRGKRKTLVGTVASAKMSKSVVVSIEQLRKHRRYGKYVKSNTKLHVHDEKGEAKEGDVVRIIECRPVSKTKHWRLIEVVKQAALET
ncbi:MAG: 30S ribosomal protein S17 [Phycisphaerae bacterium]|jgi:small subunit ribosomal protein S17|nr:30S ribosomal protein S17 [Phycisphaerae bacterium]